MPTANSLSPKQVILYVMVHADEQGADTPSPSC